MQSLFFAQIEFMSPEYDLCIRLRDKLLRKPLNLEFTEKQLEDECKEFHFGVFNHSNQLLACLSFKPLNSYTLKMRQVAVDDEFQGKGIGKFLVGESEKWALRNNFSQIELHARDIAVPFYLSLNYQRQGEMFEEVGIPHWSMKKMLTI